MTKGDLMTAFVNGIPLKWNDPDPIEGNDYTITNVLQVNKEAGTATIEYNGGSSEAEVYLSEIERK